MKRGAGLSPVETYLTDVCTVTMNITGLPALSLPCGYDENALPVGMQLVGKAFREADILNAAQAFEQATDGAFLTKLDIGVKL
jgi:aspartyl-tRNA(Asn)/glutamyl-tRNA(Gln) amidotransferase subunit A